MLAPVTFLLPGGQQINPMYLAPWFDEPVASELPGLLRGMRGEWPCVPFGAAVPPDGFPARWARCFDAQEATADFHGHGANHDWQWLAGPRNELHLRCVYPEDHDIDHLVRRVRPRSGEPAIDIDLEIHARRPTRLPIGLHATFSYPVGTAILEPGTFRDALTRPARLNDNSLFAPDRQVSSLAAVPDARGGTVDAARLPLPRPAEDLLQINGTDGNFALRFENVKARIVLRWDAGVFPSVLLWYSNKGIADAPFSGRHQAMGIEPICGAFAFGLAPARGENPIARSGIPTAVALSPDRALVTSYSISAEPIR